MAMTKGCMSILRGGTWLAVQKMLKVGRRPSRSSVVGRNSLQQVGFCAFATKFANDSVCSGLVVREKNYLNVFIYDKWNGHYVPDFQEGEEFQPTVCEIREGQTSKPNYLTEADLVTLMDKNGIGSFLRLPFLSP